MEGLNLIDKLGRVEAPPGFEQKVMAQLSLRKRKQARTRRLSLSLAGAFSAALVIIVAVNVLLIPQRGKLEFSGLEGEIPPDFRRGMSSSSLPIPITERVSYPGEVRSLRSEPPTIYILEQISSSTDTKIKY